MSAPEYGKIETYFNRDKEFKINVNDVRCQNFGQIRYWLVTEKIDGTNIRISLELMEDGHPNYPEHYQVKFYGRTRAANIPAHLFSYLQDTFTVDKLLSLCNGNAPHQIVLYGEGYGEKIQSGGDYRKGVSFRLFDVLIANRWWLDWDNVSGIADKLEIKTAPIVYYKASIHGIILLVKRDFPSHVASQGGGEKLAEGIVARTDPYLYDKHGHPIKFKLKTKDFLPGKVK